MTQTVPLDSEYWRKKAVRLVEVAPLGHVVTVSPPKRSTDQNSRFWAMLSDISQAKPDGRSHTPETWRDLFMHAMGHATRFEMGLNGEPFPIGFRSSRLSKSQMSDLMEFMSAWAAEKGITLHDQVAA